MRELLLVLVAELIAFALASEPFLTAGNLAEIARASVELGLLALGATFVMRAGAIDLSCGAVLALAAIVFGATRSLPLALVAGLVLGVTNGLLVTRLAVPPLIATLGTMALFRGLALGWTGGHEVYTGFTHAQLSLGQGDLLGVPVQLLLLVPIVLACAFALHKAPFGTELLAIGLAPSAALHAGVRVSLRVVQAYALAGLLAAGAAVIQAARLGQAKADQGLGQELIAITIALLGGTSVPGTMLALATIAVLHNGLRLCQLPTEWAGIGTGCLLLLAVALARARASGTASLATLTRRLMTNRQLLVLVAAILLASAMICAGLWRVADALRPPASNTTQRVRVAMLPKNKSDPYFASCRQGAEEAAKELGVELLWDGPNDTDAARQNEIVEGWITGGVDVIAASVENKDAISTVLTKARARGIKVLTWDADALPAARDFLVNQATAAGIGEALADEAARILGGQGRLAIVTASLTAQNQNEWIAHIKARLASAHPRCEIAVIRPSEGLRDHAFSETKSILAAHPDVRVICAIASAAVPGAAEAVKQAGSSVKVIGLSVPSLCKRYVHEGTIESIVLWNTVDLGYLTVRAAHALRSGVLKVGVRELGAGRLGVIAVEGDQVMLGKPFRFTRENIDRFDF